ncbi:phospholipase D family protein [Algivirga pacifica]|uniref:Phospholipase D-like domain-containing protein n=1 Tax=Algivirga pacifica TaxID=1162670 RepID=A0ABP9DC63_9BACT
MPDTTGQKNIIIYYKLSNVYPLKSINHMISEVDKNEEIISTLEISSQIERMLKERSEYLVLVTPYIKLLPRFKVLLEQGLKKIQKVIVIYRENELRIEEKSWLSQFNNVELYPVKNLHAKIYLNQSTALITSMNLYEYSQINNHEIGFFFSRTKDLSRYLAVLSQINIFLKSSDHSFNIDWIIDKYEDYSVNKLFRCFMVEYDCYGEYNGKLAWDIFSSEIARLVDFPEHSFNKNGLSRSASLGRQKFEDLYTSLDFKEIIKRAKK